MAFQSVVSNNIGFGVVGEYYLDGPTRAQPAVLNSADASYNVYGRAFTTVDGATAGYNSSSDPAPLQAAAGGTGVFAGILTHPKTGVLYGSGGNNLGPSLTLPNATIVELTQECAGVIIAVPGACAVGDWVWYNTTTGILQTTAPNASAPANTARVPNGRITHFKTDAAGLAVMEINAIA